MRTRKIPSVFRTAGRLLRWNRRYSARKGEAMSADISIQGCADAVREIRKRTDQGRFAYGARALIVRDLSRVPA